MENNRKIFVCGTPIGNISDISFRVIEILKKVDIIAAEDTRKSGRLLKEYNIKTPLISFYKDNEKKRAEELINRIQSGEKVALISNAGMPGISDPGYELINRAVEQGITVVPVPGPTALVSALVVSGLPMDRFVFEGFLPRKGKKRKNRLADIKKEERTIIVYESPYRIKQTLQELEEMLGTRKIALVRELTKYYEEKIYGTCSDVLKQIADREIKGELVLVIEGRTKTAPAEQLWTDLSVVEHVELLIDKGYTKKEAIKKVAEERDVSRRDVYKEAVVINVGERKQD